MNSLPNYNFFDDFDENQPLGNYNNTRNGFSAMTTTVRTAVFFFLHSYAPKFSQTNVLLGPPWPGNLEHRNLILQR